MRWSTSTVAPIAVCPRRSCTERDTSRTAPVAATPGTRHQSRGIALTLKRPSKPWLASLPLACLRLERSMVPATTKAGLAASSCSRMRHLPATPAGASLALARSVRPSRTTNCCGPLGIDGSAVAADTLQLDLNLSRELRAVEGKSRGGRVLAHWYSRRCVSDVQRFLCDNLSGAFAGRARAFARFLSLYATQDEVMMMPNRRGHHTYSPAIRGRASIASSCWRSRCSASAM